MAEQVRTDRAAWEGEMFRLLAENVLDYALFIVAPQRHVLSWSKGAERLLGFTEEEIVGRKCDCFFTPEDVRAGVPQKELDEALANGRGDDDRWHVRKDGSRFWSSGMVTPLRDDGGSLRGFAKIMRDRTDVKRAEEQLAASRRRLQALFDTSLDAILLADDQARYVDANPAACTLLGYDREELLRRGVFDITPGPNGEAGRAAWAAFVRDGHQSGEYTLTRRDDSTAVVEYRAVANVQPGLHLSVLRDVSERKRTEEALRTNERRFKTLADSAPVGIFETDPAGNCLFVNRRWCEMAGMTPEAAAGQGWAKALHPEDRDRIFAEWYAAAGGGREFTGEYRFRTPQGHVTWLSGSAVALRDEAGTITGYIGTVTDITGLKRAEEQSRRRVEEVEKLMEVMPVAVWLSRDRECRHVLGNRAGYALLRMAQGTNLSKTAPEGEQPTHFRVFRAGRELPPDELPLQYAASQGVEVRGVEEDIVFADGTATHVYGSASPLFDEAGAVRGAVAAFLDVSALRRTEAALRESRELLRSIIDNSPSVIFVKDAQGRYLLANKACEAYSGEPPERMLGKTDADFLPREYAERFRADDLRVLQTGDVIRYEEEAILHGQVVTAFTVKFPLRDAGGRPYAVCGIATDITELKRASRAVQASEERYRTLFESMDEGYCVIEMIFDPLGGERAVDYRFLEVNPAFEAQAGMRNATGRRMREFVADIEEHWLANYGRVALTGEPIRFANEYTGLNRWFEVYAFRVGGAGSRRVGVLFTDITLRKRAEDDRERLVGQLRDADRRKDEFLATLAHELRNPLAPLRNGLQVMKLAAGNAEAVEQARGMMERQLGTMVRLVDDLLDVSRITRGKLQLRRERVELATVVQSAVEGSRPLIEANRHDLTIRLPAEPVHLEGDPTRLAQVFANLLTNAAKYTDRGGRITLTAERDGGEVVVSVRDTGIGISSDHLPNLFEMFSQVDSALERSQGGLGIGLSLVKGLVRMHGGSVEARSEGPGKGSEFSVRLPVLNRPPTAVVPQAGGGDNSTSRGKRRILIADDNRDAADSLAMLLRLAGHEVHAVHDGQEAVDAAAWFRPELALLDIGMPRLNGYEACRRIREQPWGKGVVLVALTGWGQDEDKRRATEAGFDHHLTKPVDPAALVRLLAGLKST